MYRTSSGRPQIVETKIIALCDGATSTEQGFLLGRSQVTITTHLHPLPTGESLGFYAFSCQACGLEHVRVATAELVENLVSHCGVAPVSMKPEHSLRLLDEDTASALSRVAVNSLRAEAGTIIHPAEIYI